MGLSSLFGPILGLGGAPRQLWDILKSKSKAALSGVKAAVQATSPQKLIQLHAADSIAKPGETTAPRTKDRSEIKVLYSAEQIQKRIQELAQQISRDYKDVDDLVVVGVLKGAFIFTADLVRAMGLPAQIEFIKLSSYNNDKTESSGKVKAVDLSLPKLTGRNVLVVEDIVDSGRTAKFLLDLFNNDLSVKSVKIAALFDKPCRRAEGLKHIKPDYCGFTIDDHFIVGYGLDHSQNFRELPYVGRVEVSS
jgi:hypoxanthine phosphoribosyltransferase